MHPGEKEKKKGEGGEQPVFLQGERRLENKKGRGGPIICLIDQEKKKKGGRPHQ